MPPANPDPTPNRPFTANPIPPPVIRPAPHPTSPPASIARPIPQNPVPIHDLPATFLHLFGLDHLKLTHRFQGREYRLTDVAGNVIPALIARS